MSGIIAAADLDSINLLRESNSRKGRGREAADRDMVGISS